MVKLEIDGIKAWVDEPSQKEVEVYSPRNDVTNITQPTELGESLRELNKDDIDAQDTRMSGIDLRARLHPAEVSSVLALDALVSLKVLSTDCLAFTRQKKRLSVSIEGKGRDDIVAVVAGKREQDAKIAGVKDRINHFFTGSTPNGDQQK